MRFEMQLDMQKKIRMMSALIKEHEMEPKENNI